MVACNIFIFFLCIEDLKKASKFYPVLFLFDIEINFEHIHTHANSISNQEQTCHHLTPDLVLASFTWGPDFSCPVFHGNLHPAEVT